MEVEIISPKTQRFNGVNYYKLAKYYQHCGRHKSYLLHRIVWAYHHGEIPLKHAIHHKDHDINNNQISNLEIMSRSAHGRLHMSSLDRREQSRKIMLEITQKYAAKWPGSNEGKIFHKWFGKKVWENKKLFEKNCDFCGRKYKTYFPNRSKFCHLNCKMANLWTRRGRNRNPPKYKTSSL